VGSEQGILMKKAKNNSLRGSVPLSKRVRLRAEQEIQSTRRASPIRTEGG